MATDLQIQELRLLVAEPEDVAPWTDDALSDLLDSEGGDFNRAAVRVWRSKAAAAADLVDVSEGGSSRSMGDLQEKALSMLSHFEARIVASAPVVSGTKRHRLTR